MEMCLCVCALSFGNLPVSNSQKIGDIIKLLPHVSDPLCRHDNTELIWPRIFIFDTLLGVAEL